MNMLTRRAALRGMASVAAVAVPIVPVLAANDASKDAVLLARVDQWHQTYEKFKQEAEIFEQSTRLADFKNYTPGAGTEEFSTAHEELSEVQPKTVAGAIILLGCVQRNDADRGSWNVHYRPPPVVYLVDMGRLRKNAYAALRRLAGEG